MVTPVPQWRDDVRAVQEWLAAIPGHEWRVVDRGRWLGPEHVVLTLLPVAVVVARDPDLGYVVGRLEKLR
jgi:hypothetical protein